MTLSSGIPQLAEQCSGRAKTARLDYRIEANALESSVADLIRGAPTPRLKGDTMLRTTLRAFACALMALAALTLSVAAPADAATTPTVENLTTGADAQAFPPDIAVGDTLRGSDNDWAGSGIYVFQWHRCWDAQGQVCEIVDGATSRDYTTTTLDWGLQMKFCAQVPRFDTACSLNTRIVKAEHADTDSDGVPDYSDPCPATAGPSNGCALPPAPSETTTGSQGGGTASSQSGSSTTSEPSTSSITPTSPGLPLASSPNGVGATNKARLTVVLHRSQSLKVRFGKRATLRGSLLDPAGRPISGAIVDVLARRDIATAKLKAVSKVVTASDGHFTYVAPVGTSRIIRFAYRADTTDTAFASSTDVRLLVSGAVTLRVKRKVKNGTPTIFRGQLLGKPVPPGGVLVDLQVLLRKKWRTFATPRTRANGAYRYKYRFTQGPARWVFRARIRKDSLYAYEMSCSKKVATRVTR
jgi:hypothetical protein